MRFEANLTIAHPNLRREKAGAEDGDLGMDLKLTGTLGLTAFATLLNGDDHAVALLEHLYDAEGNLRSLNFDEVSFKLEHKNIEVQLDNGAQKKKFAADLNQIAVVPSMGKAVDVSLRLQLNPDGQQVAWLAELIGSEVRIIAETKQSELPLSQQVAQQRAEEEKAVPRKKKRSA